MDRMLLGDVLAAVKGELLTPAPVSGETSITGVTIDNRTVKEGDLFFAIVGEKNDGHRYAAAAVEAGAAGCLVSRPAAEIPEILKAAEEKGSFVIRVKDTSLALGDLARAYRLRYDVPVVAVTGSVGKTTAKDMIASVLSEKYRVLKTPANKNNNFGLPLTIFSFDHTYDMMVLEMGMNHFGEIEYLSGIGLPDAAVITNIGDAHIGNLGSREGILKAKCEMLKGMNGGDLILNGDDPLLLTVPGKIATGELPGRDFRITFTGNSENCGFRCVSLTENEESIDFTAATPLGTLDIHVPAPGAHMIYPALNAAAVGALFGLTAEEITAGIVSYEALRMPKEVLGGNVIIYNDTYNASPQSMKSSLHVLSAQKGVRHIAVLGDMLEQGVHEEKLHREVGAAAAAERIDTLVCVGVRARFIAEEAERNGLSDVRCFETVAEAAECVRGLVHSNTAMLFKASHVMGLDRLAAAAKDRALHFEIWDAYLKDGSLAGRDLVRGETVPEGLYHLACGAMVRHKDGSFLLTQRDWNKEGYPGRFEIGCGGSAKKGEDALTCMKRELEEETGITDGEFIELNYVVDDPTQQHFHDYLVITGCDKDGIRLQEGETIAWKWLSESEFADFVNSDQVIDVQLETYRDWFRSKGYLK